MPGRRCTGLVLALVIAATARADDGLETKALRAAAIGCQKAISKAHEAAARARIAALERCSGDALKCIQSEEPNEACLEKAAATCAARLVKAASALDKLAGKIVANKNCSRRLRLVDLLRPEGLGFGRLIGACVADSGLDACTGLRPLADCIVRSSDRIAAGAYGRGAPRSSELIDLLRGHAAPRPVPTVDGLPHFPGCGPCAVVQVERKALGACGRTIRRSFVKLLATWEKHLATCARKAFACAQAGTNAARCRRKAEAACTTALSPRLARALTTFRTTVTEKQCALAAIDYARIVGQQGLNFAALADECAALGIPDLAAASTPEVLARCLEARSRCLVAERLRSSLPRAEDLAAAGLLGAEAGAAIAETCPTEAGPGVPTVRAATFGSLLKLVKAIRRGNLNAARSRGVPAPRRFAPRRVRAPRGMRFGSITKIPVRLTYDLGGTPVNRRHTAVLDAPPQLIVSLLGGDGEPDHFAVDLDPPPPTQNEVEIEIELEEGITNCAFTLGFATRQDGEVSAYTPLLFVHDPEAPPLATSTPATPTPTASSTPTRSATPTPTLSPTPTVTATPHSAILRLFNVDDAVSAFLNDHGASAVGATFQQDRSFDVSPQLACGENRLTVRVTNGGGPYTYGAELSVDGFQRVSSTCGTVASGGGVSIGCNDGDTTEGLVAVEHAYFCLDCGTGCASQGTCASPYQVPAARFARVKTNLGGTSARTSGCGTSAGPEKIFRWIPPTSGCYAISTCGSGPFTTVLDVRAGDCGTGGSCGSPAGCAGHRTFTGQFAAQTAYFISVDSPSTASTGGALTLTIRPSSFCVD